MKHQVEAPIQAHERLSEHEFELTVLAPEIAREARPGQFVQVLYDSSYNPFSRRPFSVYRVDRAQGTFSIVYLARGVFTQGLRAKRPGQALSLVGPLGNCYTPDPTPGVSHVMVAGGVGAPPLYFLASELRAITDGDFSLVVINGARTQNLLVALREFATLEVDLRVTTDDGSHGIRGLVTHALSDLLAETPGAAHVYTCGPTAMLRAVADLCLARSIPCQVSVETPMPCGVGVCMGCVVKVRDESEPSGFSYRRSCYDGPVFRAEEILWD